MEYGGLVCFFGSCWVFILDRVLKLGVFYWRLLLEDGGDRCGHGFVLLKGHFLGFDFKKWIGWF